VSFPNLAARVSFLAFALMAISLLAGCAHDNDPRRKDPRHVHLSSDPPKWYQSDMDAQDRSFFLGPFLNGSSR